VYVYYTEIDWLVNTAQYSTFEHIAVFLHGSALKSLFVVIYRPGSSTASTIFFDELADLLNLTTSYSSVVVMGDVNLHLDMQTASSTSSFSSLLAANNLVQVVQSPTHTAGHLLDIVAVGSGTAVTSVNVPPPFLSDHSMIDVALDLCCANHHGFRSTICRSWRSFSYDDFERDLLQSDLIRSPPNDVHELVIAYDVTLSSLLDVHAPYRVIRRSTRPFQVWYDSDCRIARASSSTLSYNCLTRHLEEPVLHPATSLLPESDRLLEENDCRVRWRCTAALV